MTLKNTKLVLGIATAIFALTGTVASTEAVAKPKKAKFCKNKKGKKVKCAKKYKKRVKTYRTSGESAYVAPVAASAPVTYDDSALRAKLAEQDAKIAKLEAQPVEPVSKSTGKDNMVFFRGGYARMDQKRDGVSIHSNAIGGSGAVLPGYQGHHPDHDAWYFGAGLDFSINDDLFGLMDKTEVLGEIMFEYKQLNEHTRGNVLATNFTTNNGQAINPPAPRNVDVSMFTLTASPKIKFMKGSDFRPWLIPVGFSMNVISPPSESITVLQPAMMFGTGADYRVWKDIYVGADVRYHWAPGRMDGVNTNGFTAGGYVGLGF